MITKIRMKNWKSHLDTSLDFSPGVNCLIGVMGSGKTSVMQAISFALFGNFPSLQNRRVSLADMIMRKPKKADKAEVSIEFSVDNDVYFVKRIIGKKGTLDVEIRKNDKLLEVSSKRVTEEVEKILDMDYALFSKAVYSEQDGLDYFLRIPKGKRMEHIDNLLHVDRFAKAGENSVTVVNKIKTLLDEKIRSLSVLEEDGVKEKIVNVKKELHDFQEKKKIITKQIDYVKKRKSEISDKIEKHKNQEEEIQKTKMMIISFEGQLKEMKESFKLKSVELKGLNEKELMKNVKDGEEILNKKQEQLEELRKKHHEMFARQKLVLESFDKIDNLGNKCPLCESEITHDRKNHLLKEKQEETQRLEEEIPKNIQKIEDAKNDIEKKENLLREFAKKLERFTEYKHDKEMQKLREDNIQKKLLELQNELNDLGDVENIKEIQKEYEKLISDESRLESQIHAVNDRIIDREPLLEELEKRIKIIENYRKEIKLYENMMRQMNIFSNVLKSTQNQLREHFLESVNSVMDQIWGDLYPYEDFSSVRLAVDSRRGSKDYILQLKESTGWTSADGIASGGERSMACLALRIAFSLSFIPNLKWLILDEPTHNLDKHAIEKFSSILRDSLGNFAQQIFLITHEEGLSNLSGTIYIFERNKSRDEPTRIV